MNTITSSFCSRGRRPRRIRRGRNDATAGLGAAGYSGFGRSVLRALTLVAALAVGARAGDATKKDQPVPDDQKARIAEAVAALKVSKPAKPRKLLVFYRTEGFYHGCIPVANAALVEMGRKTGAFEPVLSMDMAAFDAKNLEAFDGVLFNNTTHLAFDNPAHRQALMDFLKGGKGVAGLHAASDNFYTWPEAAEMMGGVFDGHPWGGGGTWAVKVDEPGHPICRGFASPTFMIKDEIYQVKGAYSRDTLRVLVSLDMSNDANWKVDTNQMHRADKDFGIAWIRPYGKGRVFYSSFGHNNEIFWNREVMQHFLDGIQYAMGDYAADDRPSSVAAGGGGGTAAGSGLGAYTEGGSRAAYARIEEEIRTNDPAALGRSADALLGVLADPSATRDAKEYACRLLARTGSEKAVQPVAALLADPGLSAMARFALEKIPGEAAVAALRNALGSATDDALKTGLATSLGRRQDVTSVPAIAKLCAGGSPAVAGAALAALGNIGGPEAFGALASMRVPEALETQRLHALLVAADRVPEKDLKASLGELKKLMGSQQPLPIRIGALSCLLRAGDAEAQERILGSLKSGDAGDRAMGLRFAAEVKGEAFTRALCDVLPSLPEPDRAGLLAALALRGDGAAAASVAALAASGPEAVRIAALRALGGLGGAAEVPVLIDAAVAGGAAGDAARASLSRLTGAGVEDALRKLFSDGEASKRALAAQLAGLRSDKGSLGALVKAVSDSDGAVSEAAVQALGQMAGEAEWKPLLDALVAARDPRLRGQLEKAIVRVGGRLSDPGAALASVKAAMGPAEDAVKASLLAAAASIGTAEALAVVVGQAAASDSEVSRAAVRQLSQWRDAAAIEPLLKIAGPDYPVALRRLAVRGAVPLVGKAADMPGARKIEILRQLMAASPEKADRLAVLSGAAKLGGGEALAFVAPYAADPDLSAEAAAALKESLGDKAFVEVELPQATAGAAGGKIEGGGAAYEDKADRKCIGVWNDAKTKVHWLLSFAAPGAYDVAVSQSAAGDAGGAYAVILGSSRLEAEVKTTGSWDKFEEVPLGKVEIAAPGTYLLTVSPVRLSSTYLMNLRGVTVRKQAAPSGG